MNPLENPDPKAPGASDVNAHLIADITRPLHLKLDTWEEGVRQTEDYIANNKSFEGKWQSYVEDGLLHIPEEYWPLFETGGVVTVNTERHLLLFGGVHWRLFQQKLGIRVGVTPMDNRIVRHVLGNMVRFNKLGEGGTIKVPANLLAYAGISGEVAIIGVIYQAEVHDRSAYLHSQEPDEQAALIEQFNK